MTGLVRHRQTKEAETDRPTSKALLTCPLLYPELESQFQGLPPENMDMRKAWLQRLLRDGFHLVAITKEVGIVGHAALVELPARRSCEFLTVVMKEHRNNGIGTHLAEASINWARTLGYTSIWLTVAATNTRAIHVYKKAGFDVLSYSAELEMEAHLE